MNKINLSVSVALLLLLLTGCRKEFDDHYHSTGSSYVSSNVVEILKERPELSEFVRMIQRADLERTLGESGLYTCFAPQNEAVEAFLQSNNATVETLPLKILKQYVNYHFMTGIKYLYDFEKAYEGFKIHDEDYLMDYPAQVTQSTREDSENGSKFIRVFTQPYFDACAANYKLLRGKDGEDFMVESARVSKENRDIPASNGVVHILEDELPFAYRADEAIAREADLSILNAWLNDFVGYESKEGNHGIIDTNMIKYINISKNDGKPWILNLASEAESRVIIAPTDNAIQEYFKNYMNDAQLGTDYKQIPEELLIPIFNTLISYSTMICWGIEDIDRGYPAFTSYAGTEIAQQNELGSTYAGSVLSSNAIIYKVNKMPEIPLLQTIESGVYINRERYGEWNKMLANNHMYGLTNLLTDVYSYQHPQRTLLIQPDEVWSKKVDDYESKYLDTLGWRMQAGVLNHNVKNGEFKKQYYQAAFGYLLYEGNGIFSDYKDNKVRLLDNQPVWSKETGNIYEIDGIFEALRSNDTTELMYQKYIDKQSDFVYFNTLYQKGNTDLKTIGYLYTVFAPTNEAFESAGYSLQRLEDMEEDEARKLLANHIVPNRRVFTDGMTQGGVQSNGLVLNISGSWENFRITTQNGRAGIVQSMCNKQCSNGIFHGITGVLK